jgi:histidine kinase
MVADGGVMLELSRFQLLEPIYESSSSRVYRGRRRSDDVSVILKVLREEFPTPERIARFRREFEVTRALNEAGLEGVIQAHSLSRDLDRWVMEIEDFGAESLASARIAEGLDLGTFLQIALKIVGILEGVHAQQVIHRDLTLSNVVRNPETGEVKLIDFGISSRLSRERTALDNPEVLEGTLGYVSPEQTGRTNRTVDYRTDYYSFGVTCYELLTGARPFRSQDPLELVYEHIARRPPSPQELRPELPAVVGNIVLRLLAKNAEDRYQSARGLAADLQICLQSLRDTGSVEDFELGRHDVSDRFQLPQRLYGREPERQSLLDAFDRVARGGATELLLIAGYSGIGKSALAKEVYQPITERRGYFVAGKFDQLQRDVPYASLIQAFRSLAQQLLTEREAAVAGWRERLLAALGPNGRVITDVIPEFEWILGPQPPLGELGPAEAENRFNLAFQRFVDVFARAEHPLVMFLDDLQWADPASLSAVEAMISRKGGHLLLVGAYRDNEVDEAHPLALTLGRIRSGPSAERVTQVHLVPLAPEHVAAFVADTVSRPLEEVEDLARLVREKTDGNPFFLGGFLESLHAERLLAFDGDAGAWTWELENIQAAAITDNVIELLAGRVQRMPTATQAILQLAACVGNRFDLETLAVVSEQPARLAAAALWEGVLVGLVLPIGDGYRLMELEVAGLEGLRVEYRFAHDRVQQAVYSLIPAHERQAVHLRIGHLLLENTSPEEREERIFDLVNHLDLGADLIEEPEQLVELARLNLLAGQKARASAAYPAAAGYLRWGLRLLGAEAWTEHYALSLELHAAAAEAAHLCDDHEELERLTELVLSHGRGLLDRIRAYELRVFAYNKRNLYERTLETALHALRLLGTEIRSDLSPDELEAGFAEAARTLLLVNPEAVAQQPRMTHPEKLATVRLLMAMTSTAFNSGPELIPDMALTVVRLAHEHGYCAELAYGFCLFGIVASATPASIPVGYHAGKLAQRVQDTFGAQELKAKTYCMVNAFIRHWSEPLLNSIAPFQEGLRSGLEQGDLEYASYCAKESCAFWLFGGVLLSRVETLQTESVAVLERIGIEYSLQNANVWLQLTLNLRGKSEDRARLKGEAFDEDALREFLIESKHGTTLYALYYSKALLHYLYQEPEQAWENAQLANEHAAGGSGLQHSGAWHCYQSLIRLALCESPESEHLAPAREGLEVLRQLAEHAPSNYAHKALLVEAEVARVEGEEGAAMAAYESAVDLARESGFVHEEALAFELASRFHARRGRRRLALSYLRDAHYAYDQWGAVVKVADLEARHPELTVREPRGGRPPTTTVETRVQGGLDFASVAKASQAISSQVQREELLLKMLEIVVENAAAERGALILLGEQGPRLHVLAEPQARIMQATPLVETSELSAGVVDYVLLTGEDVVLSDAAVEGPFVHDVYVQRVKPRSVLCAPVVHGGQTRGAIYLENNMGADAFTASRVRVIRLLASQAAISLENANLFAELERANETLEAKVRQRTGELEQSNAELQQTLLRVHEMQEQIVTQQKLASLSALTAGIAHEIRNPLNFVVNFAALTEELTGELGEELGEGAGPVVADLVRTLRQNVKRIEEHGRRADRIIGMMVKHSQVYATTRETTNLDVLVDDQLRTSKSEDGPLRVRREREGDQSAAVVAQALSVALRNLIDNARWAMAQADREGEELLVRTREVENGVELVFRDPGCGIPAALHDRVCESFFSTKPPGEGAGLGLSLAHEIVTKLHQGTLEIESEEGSYTEVRLVIPKGRR